MEDELKEEYHPLFATKFGNSLIPTEDDTYPTIVTSGSFQANYIPIQHEDIGDVAAQTASLVTFYNLAIRSKPHTVRISDIGWIIDKSILLDDYSDEYALEIKIEPERKQHNKEPLYQDLYRIYRECSASDWDNYGATPISEQAFFEATKLLDLLPFDLPLPEVLPEPTGEIAFEWYKEKKHVFVLSVGGKNIISYAGLFGRYSKTYGTEYFFDELPQLVVNNVLRFVG
jgi:hypothetical protein